MFKDSRHSANHHGARRRKASQLKTLSRGPTVECWDAKTRTVAGLRMGFHQAGSGSCFPGNWPSPC